jgi:hypothetical protein
MLGFVGAAWEFQEGSAVDPLLAGCGLEAHDLGRLKSDTSPYPSDTLPIRVAGLRPFGFS